jgi:hypothetical protein
MGLPRPHEPRIRGCRTVIYSWREPEDYNTTPITNYRVTVIPEGAQDRVFILDGMTIGQVVTGLEAGVPLAATVSASADCGMTWGPEVSFESITPVKKPSVSPSTLVATATGWGTATITWSDPQPAAFIEFQTVSSNPDDPVYGKCIQDSSVLTIEFTDLNPDSVYQFSVHYGNIAGAGPAVLTNLVDFTGFSAPAPLHPLLEDPPVEE